jgi:hypothetical protein
MPRNKTAANSGPEDVRAPTDEMVILSPSATTGRMLAAGWQDVNLAAGTADAVWLAGGDDGRSPHPAGQ